MTPHIRRNIADDRNRCGIRSGNGTNTIIHPWGRRYSGPGAFPLDLAAKKNPEKLGQFGRNMVFHTRIFRLGENLPRLSKSQLHLAHQKDIPDAEEKRDPAYCYRATPNRQTGRQFV
jgi:hypothetical protein